MKEILNIIVPNCKIYEVSVNNRKGPVDAIIQILDIEINNNDEIIVSYCDYGTKWNYEEFKFFILMDIIIMIGLYYILKVVIIINQYLKEV